MDTSRLLLLLFMVMSSSESSDLVLNNTNTAATQDFHPGDQRSAEPPCEGFDKESMNLLEGEALFFVPYILKSKPMNETFTWFRKNLTSNEMENLTSNETENVHYHGGALFILKALVKDSGFFMARQRASSGKCYECYVIINVFEAKPTVISQLLYGKIKNSDEKKKIPCPDPIRYTCNMLNGSFTWNKDSKPLQGDHKDHLWVRGATKANEGIYTCICTWKHYGKEYKSSASRSLEMEEASVHRKVTIIPPDNKERFAEEGASKKLSCSLYCGTNVGHECSASWHVDGVAADQIAGYNETTKTVNQRPSNSTISTATLTIDKVSAKDFKVTFECRGQGRDSGESVSLNLKRRETIIPSLVGGVSVLCFCVFAALLVKCFTVDLALFFRPCFPFNRCDTDGRQFDAYVVYQTQSPDKVTEDALCQFVAKILPSVLEDKCGYRLFIHGRDDVPGEDRLELVEDRMKQSRRLMVILTPGSGSESETLDQYSVSPQNPEIGGFDWQVGLHHVLLQREMSVILIQLGDQGPQGYTHLPASLQHLILKSAPIRWPEGSRGAAAWNSRFWKRVRYLMPAIPAKRCPQSAVI